MNRHLPWVLVALLSLTACSSPPVTQQARDRLSAQWPGATWPDPDTPPAEANANGIPLPSGPLSQDEAVRQALARHPALRALVAEGQADAQSTLARSRPRLLSLHWERARDNDGVELTRALSLDLLAWLTWPQAHAAAQRAVAERELRLTHDLWAHLHDTRTQWVRAVAAAEKARYLDDLRELQAIATELGQRMREAGHLSPRQLAELQVQAVQADAARDAAHRQAVLEREALQQRLGWPAEAAPVQLPERLPDALALAADGATAPADLDHRLDVQLARARWQSVDAEGAHQALRSLVDIEAGAARSRRDGETVERSSELGVSLGRVDLGGAERAGARQASQAAAWRWAAVRQQAQSEWRAALTWVTSARQAEQRARATLLPLQQQLVDERLKQYNGMLVGPFELLQQARVYREAVLAVIDARRDLWLAEAAVQAAREGTASGLSALNEPVTPPAAPASNDTAGH